MNIQNKIRLFPRIVKNLLLEKPLFVGVEVTHSCNASCDMCYFWKNPTDGLAESYVHLLRELNPVVVSLTGGEPLLREDLERIAREIKEEVDPLLGIPTNGSLLTLELYHKFKNAGIDYFTIALDFPDERHDRFKNIPGLFNHLSVLIPQLASEGNSDINLNTVILKENLHDLVRIVELGKEWGARVQFNAYTPRNGNREHCFTPEQYPELKKELQILRDLRKHDRTILNSDFYFERAEQFLMGKEIPGCQAGRTLLWITPDGKYKPCVDGKELYTSFQEVRESFGTNNCGKCWYSCRVASEELTVRRGLELLMYF